MLNALFAMLSMLGTNSRRAMIVVAILIVVVVLTLTTGAIDVALAGPITSGS